MGLWVWVNLSSSLSLESNFLPPALPWDKSRAGMVPKLPQEEHGRCSLRSPWHIGEGALDKYLLMWDKGITWLHKTGASKLGFLPSYVKPLSSTLGVHYLTFEEFILPNVPTSHAPPLTLTHLFKDQPW